MTELGDEMEDGETRGGIRIGVRETPMMGSAGSEVTIS